MVFFDPLYRAPILGSCFLCYAASLMGVWIFLQRRSLIGETLSHAAYPGLVLGGIIASISSDHWLYFFIGSSLACFFALKTMKFLEKQEVSQDASMIFVLSGFFSLGLLLASYLQTVNAAILLDVQKYLFGDVVTMLDEHVYLYGALSLIITFFTYGFYRRIQIHLFDQNYAKLTAIYDPKLSACSVALLIAAIVLGSRSSGIFLVSAMLIAPVSAARAFSSSLHTLFILSGGFGVLAALLGYFLSFSISTKVALPSGPVIVLASIFLVIFSHLFAPKNGLLSRAIRSFSFLFRTQQENILKTIYQNGEKDRISLQKALDIQPVFFHFLLFYLKREGLIYLDEGLYFLSAEGAAKALRLVRSHRLWEVYLTKHMHMQAEKVHLSAEEIEHVITREMEQKLDTLLEKPEMDPHQKPIPGKFL